MATLVMVVRHLITLKLLVMETELARENGISTIVQVSDLKNSPGLRKKELRTKSKFLFAGPSKSAHTRKVKLKSFKSVEKVVAMWERRLSLKLLLAALNGKDSVVAMCRFCRLMGTTTTELLLNRIRVAAAATASSVARPPSS
ncbi:hypothetical protein JHK82_027481 [Glycine max]|nr:hypothetical protein JHK86_027607 [Glycine max]KAG5126646.1 hypothetical protein JHK82_027481 [Glycine max]KAG5151262.1 hypothetical protein JHK84_027734 [Glycine max]